MKKIAVFGGSFNPPHVAHQMILTYISNCFDFDEIWVNPVYRHYFSKDKYLVSSSDRLKMASLAFEKLSSKIFVKSIDIDNKFIKSFDTFSFLTKKYSFYSFTLFLGEDNYLSKDKWYKFSELQKLIEIRYVGREGYDSDLHLPFKFPAISSSYARGNLDCGIIDLNVLEFIKKNKLYK